jgi:hypothetical protein
MKQNFFTVLSLFFNTLPQYTNVIFLNLAQFLLWEHPTAWRAALLRATEIHTTLPVEVTTSKPQHSTEGND